MLLERFVLPPIIYGYTTRLWRVVWKFDIFSKFSCFNLGTGYIASILCGSFTLDDFAETPLGKVSFERAEYWRYCVFSV